MALPDQPQAEFPELAFANVRNGWSAPVRLSRNLTFQAGKPDALVFRPENCALPVLASISDGSCAGARSNRLTVRSYALGLNLRLDDDLSIYVKSSKSFRTRTKQLRNVGMIGSVDMSFGDRAQVRLEHEAGIRAQFLDGLLAVNYAGYFNRLQSFQAVTTLTTPTGARISNFINPSSLRNMGLEADMTIRPGLGLALYGSIASNREKYKHCAAGMCPAHSRDIIQTQFNIGANYEREIAAGRLAFNINYNWTGRAHFSSDSIAITGTIPGLNDASARARFQRALSRRSVATLDARLGLTMANSSFEVFVYGRNLADQRYIQHRRLGSDLDGSIWNSPRTVGAGVNMVF